MEQKPVCEITLTGTENREWQGSAYFPAQEKRVSFQSLMELVRAVEDAQRRGQAGTPAERGDPQRGAGEEN